MNALLDFCEKALIDDVMFFIAPEELFTGHITIEEAKKYTDVIVRAKEELHARGITVSLNPWCSLAHYDGGRRLKDGQNFRAMVGADGIVANVAVCPLCKEWRRYYVELLTFYAETIEPEILWVEDDFRLSNHLPVRNGCFCDEHMKLFNKAANTAYTREQFVAKIFTDEGVRKAYLDVSSQTLRDLLTYISENVKAQKTFGLMTGSAGQSEGRSYAQLFSILSENGRKKPYHRICLHSYRQRGMQEYAWALNKESMLSRFVSGDYANCVSEMENFPHSMYTKSANYFRYQLLSTAAMGLKGDTLSIFEFNGNGAVRYQKYANVLREVKPYLSKLDKIGLNPADMVGVQVLIDEKSSYTLKNVCTFSQLHPFDGWLFAYLEQIGVACAYTADPYVKGKIVAVSGEVFRNYPNGVIEALFENNFVILTADNIVVLKEKGLLSLIGAEDYERYEECTGKHSMEELATGEEIYGIERLRATSQFFCGDYYNVRYDGSEKKIYTHLLDYNEQIVGVGICQVHNALILPYANTNSDQNVPISLLCPLREYVIKQALQTYAADRKNLFFIQEENVCIYAFDKGDVLYLVCINFSDDDYEQLHIQTNRLFRSFHIITPQNAAARPVSYICENGDIVIKHTLKAQQSYVLAGAKIE
ncbi:MAG: hypothetical protein IJX87_00880 [Clostridia bacterium]|nr:hypothetical protein [Clostridia bacterium]